jgi:hypothetical protein
MAKYKLYYRESDKQVTIEIPKPTFIRTKEVILKCEVSEGHLASC